MLIYGANQVGPVAGVLFVLRERRAHNPLMNFSLLRRLATGVGGAVFGGRTSVGSDVLARSVVGAASDTATGRGCGIGSRRRSSGCPGWLAHVPPPVAVWLRGGPTGFAGIRECCKGRMALPRR